MSAVACPVCAVPTRHVGANGQGCPSCKGLWLERTQLKKLSDRIPAAFVAARRSRQLPCPGCGATMATLAAWGVEIDRCGPCGGLWLDSGELATLQAVLRAHPQLSTSTSMPAPAVHEPVSGELDLEGVAEFLRVILEAAASIFE